MKQKNANQLLRSFSGPEPSGLELAKESKREKEADIPWVTQRTTKALGEGLYRSRRHRASSRRGLESPGRKVSSAGFYAPENQPEGEGERERKNDTGTQVSSETRVFYQQKCRLTYLQ